MDVMVVLIGISVIVYLVSVVLHWVANVYEKGKTKGIESDNPLSLTVQAMEEELIKLRDDNHQMRRIQKLEEQLAVAHVEAEKLSEVCRDFGSTADEMVGSVEFTEEAEDEEKLELSKRKIREEIRKVDDAIHKSEYGKWNTIPQTLNKEERLLKAFVYLEVHTAEQLEQLNIWKRRHSNETYKQIHTKDC